MKEQHIQILLEQIQDDINNTIGQIEQLKQRAERLEDFVLIISKNLMQMDKVKELEKEE